MESRRGDSSGVYRRAQGVPALHQHGLIERLGCSVKYEDIYLRAYETPTALRLLPARYFDFYNSRHAALDRRTSDSVLSRCVQRGPLLTTPVRNRGANICS